MTVVFGIDKLAKHPELASDWGRCALVCNQASVDQHLTPSWQVLSRVIGDRLKVLFGPQHGFESTVQDNMIESDHDIHRPTGLRVYSLYSETRQPSPSMLDGVDTIIIDLQLLGSRVYTYKYTMAACMRAAKENGLSVVILDRPNPLGGVQVEGRLLHPEAKSFVGEYPIPMRHGLTMAEVARYFNSDIACDLEWVTMDHWDPSMYWHQLGRPWVLTSPNMPCTDAAYTFPGTVLLEGTNVSEGRGTCLPFLFIGAPFIKDGRGFKSRVLELYGPEDGIYLRPTNFLPAFQKWQGQTCEGIQIHVLDARRFQPFRLGVAILRASWELSDGAFLWKQPPYEYEYEQLPIRMILGSLDADTKLTASDFNINDEYWNDGVAAFNEERKNYFLYERS